jgi:hypothetical protein
MLEPPEGSKNMALQSQQFVVDDHGKKTAVLLPIKQYEKLMEDLHDLAIAAGRRSEEPISLSEMKKRLTRDGLL